MTQYSNSIGVFSEVQRAQESLCLTSGTVSVFFSQRESGQSAVEQFLWEFILNSTPPSSPTFSPPVLFFVTFFAKEERNWDFYCKHSENDCCCLYCTDVRRNLCGKNPTHESTRVRVDRESWGIIFHKILRIFGHVSHAAISMDDDSSPAVQFLHLNCNGVGQVNFIGWLR